MAFDRVLEQTIILFLLIVVGFVARKKNIITDEIIKGFSEFVLKVTLPMFIIVSMDKEFSKDKIVFSGLILFISIFTYIFKILLSKLFVNHINVLDSQKNVYRALIIFSNSGFMGFPIAYAIYGDDGIFYAAMLNIAYNISLWTLGVKLLRTQEKTQEGGLKKLLSNPGIFSVFIGLIVFLTPLTLPKLLFEPMNMVGSMTTPLAMIVVGGILGATKIGNAFKNKKLIIASLIRLLFIPLFILLILLPFGLPKIVLGIIVIIDAMPCAANVAIFARRYDSDYSLASQGVFLSTLLNIVTTPLILYIFLKITA